VPFARRSLFERLASVRLGREATALGAPRGTPLAPSRRQ
jgi:hypothetical protein